MSKFIVLGLDGACPGIIDAAMADGLLPNFRRLCREGCWAENVPFPSAVTPGNWTSIATGSTPATHGISDFAMHAPGTPLDHNIEVFTKRNNHRAEFLWDAWSDRGRRAATLSYPAALPQTKPLHLAIGSYGRPLEGSPPWTIARSRAIVAGGLDPVGPYGWREHEAVSLAPADGDAGVEGFRARRAARFSVEARAAGYSGRHEMVLYLGTRGGKDVAVVAAGDERFVVGPREWTPYLARPFWRDAAVLQPWRTAGLAGETVVGEFRLRVVAWRADRGQLLLYLSDVYPRDEYTSDDEAGGRLRERFGRYTDELPISRLIMGWLDDDAFRDEFRAQGVWQARAAGALVNDLGCDAVFTKWHAFDKFYHFFLQKIDPVSPRYDPAEAGRCEGLHRVLLGIADEMVGIVLDGMRADTSLVVISDHGLMASRRCAWVNRLLARHGYIACTTGPDGRTRIDWSRTRAYVAGYLLLKVNLKGREPDGIVEPGRQYESLKAELIELLRSWRDETTGRHVMTDVFDPASDGAFYGLGSELDGDVRYFTAPGYTLYRSTAADGDELLTDARGPYLGDHGSCRPTTHFGRGGEVGLFCAAGRGFRRGVRRRRSILPSDVIPTLLHIGGDGPLRNQEGAVLHDLLCTS